MHPLVQPPGTPDRPRLDWRRSWQVRCLQQHSARRAGRLHREQAHGGRTAQARTCLLAETRLRHLRRRTIASTQAARRTSRHASSLRRRELSGSRVRWQNPCLPRPRRGHVARWGCGMWFALHRSDRAAEYWPCAHHRTARQARKAHAGHVSAASQAVDGSGPPWPRCATCSVDGVPRRYSGSKASAGARCLRHRVNSDWVSPAQTSPLSPLGAARLWHVLECSRRFDRPRDVERAACNRKCSGRCVADDDRWCADSRRNGRCNTRSTRRGPRQHA